jgi:hypothetical protein
MINLEKATNKNCPFCGDAVICFGFSHQYFCEKDNHLYLIQCDGGEVLYITMRLNINNVCFTVVSFYDTNETLISIYKNNTSIPLQPNKLISHSVDEEKQFKYLISITQMSSFI